MNLIVAFVLESSQSIELLFEVGKKIHSRIPPLNNLAADENLLNVQRFLRWKYYPNNGTLSRNPASQEDKFLLTAAGLPCFRIGICAFFAIRWKNMKSHLVTMALSSNDLYGYHLGQALVTPRCSRSLRAWSLYCDALFNAHSNYAALKRGLFVPSPVSA